MLKEAIRKSLLKLKPALKLLNVLVDMSKARSVPRERKSLPISPEKLMRGLYPASGSDFNPKPPDIPP
jgi:hypothetical protein